MEKNMNMEEDDPKFYGKLQEFCEAKRMSARWEAKRKEKQKECVELFKQYPDVKTVLVKQWQDKPLRATLVKSETVKIDEDRLSEALGEEMWDKITTRKLDMDKLEDMVATGAIDAGILGDYSEVVPRTAFIKLTHAKLNEEFDA